MVSGISNTEQAFDAFLERDPGAHRMTDADMDKLSEQIYHYSQMAAKANNVNLMDAFKTASRLGYAREQLVKNGFPGAVAVPAVDDLQPEIAKFHMLHRGREYNAYGIVKGMIFDNYNEAVISPIYSSDVSSYASGSKANRHFRVPIDYVPDGTIMFSMVAGSYLVKRVADGGLREDRYGNLRDEHYQVICHKSEATPEQIEQARKPLAYRNKQAAEASLRNPEKHDRSQLMHYWETYIPNDGVMEETGKVDINQYKAHQRKYGRPQWDTMKDEFELSADRIKDYKERIRDYKQNHPHLIQTEGAPDDGSKLTSRYTPRQYIDLYDDKERRIYFSEDDAGTLDIVEVSRLNFHIPKFSKTVGNGQSMKKNADFARSQASGKVYLVDHAKGEIKEDRWLWKSGAYMNPKEEYPPRLLQMTDKVTKDLVEALASGKKEKAGVKAYEEKFAENYRWIWSGKRDEVPPAFNDWKEPEQRKIFTRLREDFQTEFQDVADNFRALNQMSMTEEQREAQKRLIVEGMETRVRDFYSNHVEPIWKHEKNAKQRLIHFGSVDKYADTILSVDHRGDLTQVYLGKEVREYHPKSSAELWLHSTWEKTISPLGGGMRNGMFSGGNRPATANWEQNYFVDADKHAFLKRNLPGYARNIDPTDVGQKKPGAYAGDPWHRKAKRIIQFVYDKEMRTTAYDDALPTQRMVETLGKQYFEYKIGTKNLFEGLGWLIGGTLLAAGLFTGVAAAAGVMLPIALAIGAVPGVLGGMTAYTTFAEERFNTLDDYARRANLDIAKMYDERASKKGLSFMGMNLKGLGGLKEDFALSLRGLRGIAYEKLRNRDRINFFREGGKGLVLLGVIGLAIAAVGALGPAGIGLLGAASAPSAVATFGALVGGLVTAATGVMTWSVGELADKGRIHTLADYFNVVSKGMDKNKDAYSDAGIDIINRVGHTDFARDMQMNADFISEITHANDVLDRKLGLRRNYLSELKEVYSDGIFGIGKENKATFAGKTMAPNIDQGESRRPKIEKKSGSYRDQVRAKGDPSTQTDRTPSKAELAGMSHGDRARLMQDLQSLEPAGRA